MQRSYRSVPSAKTYDSARNSADDPLILSFSNLARFSIQCALIIDLKGVCILPIFYTFSPILISMLTIFSLVFAFSFDTFEREIRMRVLSQYETKRGILPSLIFIVQVYRIVSVRKIL